MDVCRKKESLTEAQMEVIKGSSFVSGLGLVCECVLNMCAFVLSKEIQCSMEALTIVL